MALLDSLGFGMSTAYADFANYGVLASLQGNAGMAILTGGPLGDNYLYNNNGNWNSNVCGVERVFPTAAGTFFFGCRFQPLDSNQQIGFMDTGAPNNTGAGGFPQFVLNFNAVTGVISVISGLHGGSLLAQSPAGSFVSGQWFYLEVGGVIGVSGSVTVRVNGATVIPTTAANTYGSSGQTGASATVGGVAWVGLYNDNANAFIQHMYFCDNSTTQNNNFLGDVRVQSLFPTGPGATTQFTPVGGATNWQNAATVPPAPTVDYNTDGTVGALDNFAIAGLDPSFATIKAINVKTLALKSSSGTRSMASTVLSGSTTGTGASTALGPTGRVVAAIFPTAPATSAAWTTSGVQASKPGYTVSG